MKVKISMLLLALAALFLCGCEEKSLNDSIQSYDRPTVGVVATADRNVLAMCEYDRNISSNNTVKGDELKSIKNSGTYQVINPTVAGLKEFLKTHSSAKLYFNGDYNVFIKF